MTKKILIVDDDRSIVESLTKLLRNEGYDVFTAENGRKAVDQMLNEHVDLLLLDIVLPERDGWVTLNWLSQVNIRCPVIVITGRSNQRGQAEKAGADALVEKPLNVPRLLQLINELVNEPLESRLQRAIHRITAFQFVSCDEDQYRELQNKRFTAPWPPPAEFQNN